MRRYFYNGILWALLTGGVLSCSNKVEDIDALLANGLDAQIETGKNVIILYSDSAQVRLVLHAPIMERHLDSYQGKDVFPKGILLEFMNKNLQVVSWLKAETAVRDYEKQRITARGNVIFYNEREEKLETSELIFDEIKREAFSEKLVRISQAEKGDTTYGFGFRATDNFTRFEIRKKVQGKVNVSEIITNFD